MGAANALTDKRAGLRDVWMFAEDRHIERHVLVVPPHQAGNALALPLRDDFARSDLGLHLRLALGIPHDIARRVLYLLKDRLALGVHLIDLGRERSHAGVRSVWPPLGVNVLLDRSADLLNRQRAVAALADELLHDGQLVNLADVGRSARKHQVRLTAFILQHPHRVGRPVQAAAVLRKVGFASHARRPLRTETIHQFGARHPQRLGLLAGVCAQVIPLLDHILDGLADGVDHLLVALGVDALIQPGQEIPALGRVE